MNEDKARILVLGKSSSKGIQPFRKLLSEIFTQEIPVEFVETITVKFDDNSSKTYIPTENILMDNIKQSLDTFKIKKPFDKVEIILNLDLVYEKISTESKHLLNNFFEDNT